MMAPAMGAPGGGPTCLQLSDVPPPAVVPLQIPATASPGALRVPGAAKAGATAALPGVHSSGRVADAAATVARAPPAAAALPAPVEPLPAAAVAASDEPVLAYQLQLLALYTQALELLQRRAGNFSRLGREFCEVLERDDHIELSTSRGMLPLNRTRNRYMDVLPYDRNRVRLPLASQALAPPGGARLSSTELSGSFAMVGASPPRSLGSGLRSSRYVATLSTSYDSQRSEAIAPLLARGGAGASAATCASVACAAPPADGGAAASHPASDYINASYVRDGRAPPGACGYVATQGPLQHTVGDFWEMLRAVRASAVVMLTNVSEFGRPKCEQYFPLEAHDTLLLPSGVAIKCVHRTQLCPGIAFRQLEAAYPAPGGGASGSTADGVPQCLWLNHYQYTTWPDFGVPQSTAAIRTLCRALDGCRRASSNIVVHCSAGVGRTGTFCAIDIILQRLDRLRQALPRPGSAATAAGGDAVQLSPPSSPPPPSPALQQQQQQQQQKQAPSAHGGSASAAMPLLPLPHGPTPPSLRSALKEALNVPAVVHSLRKQRMGMVQTGEQYMLCYSAVVEELEALREAAVEQLALMALETRSQAAALAAAAAPPSAAAGLPSTHLARLVEQCSRLSAS